MLNIHCTCEKPLNLQHQEFECTICNVRYPTKDNCVQHIKDKHEEFAENPQNVLTDAIKIHESTCEKPPPAKKLKLSKPLLKRVIGTPIPNAEKDPWLKDLAEKYQPSCDCFSGDNCYFEPDSGPFYTHLGVAKTLPELRKVRLI